jgi:MFS family permease
MQTGGAVKEGSALMARSPELAPPAAIRWAVLIAVSIAMFGNYYLYDSIAPLAGALKRDLGFSDTQIGTLNAIYSIPNLFMVLIGGILVDRFGTRLATVGFTAICLVGAVVTAATPYFGAMALGRLLFGVGAESMILAITTALAQWFKLRQLAFVLALNVSIARAGSYAADLSPSWAKALYDSGWRGPLIMGVGFGVLSLIGAFLYWILERVAEPRYKLGRPQPADRIVWSDLLRFDRSYWYVAGLCVTFYSVIFPFRSTFAIKYFQDAHGMSLEKAGEMNGYVFLAAIFATPVFGFLIDKVGKRSLFMALGSLALVPVFMILGYTQWNVWIPTALLGIAFSLVPAVLWPSVPHLVDEKRLGTGYGVMTLLQNVGLSVMNIAAGALNDASRAGASNPAGYLPMLWMFALVSLAGLAFSALLRARETGPLGHGLEAAAPTA